ncbi:MAG: hypothetical protein LZF86_110494 [Nitrospira sp.]|nr:MAG: hypothetical protein LZF86_110494 [Nitrospira sp.]
MKTVAIEKPDNLRIRTAYSLPPRFAASAKLRTNLIKIDVSPLPDSVFAVDVRLVGDDNEFIVRY